MENDQENVPPANILPDFSAYEFPRTLRSALKGLESLPSELQTNFHHMRDLDQQAQNILKDIDVASDEYLKEVKSLSPDKRAEQLALITKMFNGAKELSDDKVQLAVQTYELVDKHIRRLDSDLAKFEAEVKEKPLLCIAKKEDEGTVKKKGRKKKEETTAKNSTKKKKKGNSDDEEQPQKTPANVGRKKKKNANKEGGGSGVGAVGGIASVLPLSAISYPTEAMDMPVDPNEPTYCLCHQVSYGEMIACDKTDCPIEWFHFACVNLTTKPKGKWYCPRCSTDIKKKK